MPGLITNYLFGERSYQALSPNYLKDVINAYPNAYRIGLQGPNVFFYYLNNYMRRKKSNICNVLHEKNTGAFMEYLIDYMSMQEGEKRQICIAYIAGFLCHYALDIHTHPYLTYRVKEDLKEHPEFSKTPFYYQRIETLFDTLLLKRLNHMDPGQLNLEALVSVSKKERQQISGCLLYALKQTYHYRTSKKTLDHVLCSVRRTSIFLQSNIQMHRRLSTFFERCFKHTASTACFIYPEYNGDPKDYLNESKNPWETDVEGATSNDSFFEILNNANDYSRHLLESFDDYLAWNGSKQHFLNIIGSRSYYTGRDTLKQA